MANITGGTKNMKSSKRTPGKKDYDDAEPLREDSVTSMTRSTTKVMTTKDYTEENEYLKGRIEEQAKTIAMLRQKEVDQNQVTVSKEEYKKRNNELIEENLRLQNENKMLQEQSNHMFAAEIETRKQYIQDLGKRSAQLIVQYNEMQEKFREMESSVSQKDFGFDTELAKEKEKLKEMQAKVDRVTGQLQHLVSRKTKGAPLPTNVQNFVKERNEVLDFIMDRGKDIQDHQKENFLLFRQVEQFEQLVIKLQDEIAKMKEGATN